jgi:hypothetical protein
MQKAVAGLILIGVITAATLPGRNTVGVLGGIKGLVTGAESTAITGQA